MCSISAHAEVPFESHTEMYLNQPYIDITYRVHLQRRPLYYVIYMILPTTILSLISLLAFLLPSDSGEKIGLGRFIICHSMSQVSQSLVSL